MTERSYKTVTMRLGIVVTGLVALSCSGCIANLIKSSLFSLSEYSKCMEKCEKDFQGKNESYGLTSCRSSCEKRFGHEKELYNKNDFSFR